MSKCWKFERQVVSFKTGKNLRHKNIKLGSFVSNYPDVRDADELYVVKLSRDNEVMERGEVFCWFCSHSASTEPTHMSQESPLIGSSWSELIWVKGSVFPIRSQQAKSRAFNIDYNSFE